MSTRMVTGRLSGVMVDGRPQCDVVLCDTKIYETKPYYKYECEWEKLKTIVSKVKKNEDCTGEVLGYMSSIPKIVVNVDHEDDRDPAGRGYSMVMKSIIQDINITACIGCTPGDIYRLYNCGKKHYKMYHYLDEKWPMKRKAEERKSMLMVRDLMDELQFTNPLIEVKSMGDLRKLNEYFFCGYLGYLLHDGVVQGIAPELNYYAAISYGVTILDTVDKDDRVLIKYLKNGGTWTFEFRKECKLYAINGSAYINNGGKTDFKTDANIYNVISTIPITLKSEYYEIEAIEALHVAERAIVPAISQTRKINDNGNNYVIGCDKNSNPVWIIQPALEIRSNKYHLERLTGARYLPYTGHEFTTISSAMNVYHTFLEDTTNVKEYKVVEYDFPSTLYYHDGVWKNKAYPNALIDIKGRKYIMKDGKRENIEYGKIIEEGTLVKGQKLKINKNYVVIGYWNGDGQVLMGKVTGKNVVIVSPENLEYVTVDWDRPYEFNLCIPMSKDIYWKNGDVTKSYIPGEGGKYVLGSCPQFEKSTSLFIKLRNVINLEEQYEKILYEDLAVKVHGKGNIRLYEFLKQDDADKFRNAHLENVIDHAFRIVHMVPPFNGETVLWETEFGTRTSFYKNPLVITEYIKFYKTYDARLVMSFDRNQRFDGGTVGGGDYISVGDPSYIDDNDE